MTDVEAAAVPTEHVEEGASEQALKKQKTEGESENKQESQLAPEIDEALLDADDVADVAATPLVIHPLSHYTFGKGGQSSSRERTKREKFIGRKALFEREGVRQSVAAVLLTHHSKVPTVLLLRKRDSESGRDTFMLPESRLRPGEDVLSGIVRCLNKRLCGSMDETPSWQCAGLVGKWIRPQFDDFMAPYELPHVSNPKQVLSLYMVQMPTEMAFRINQSAVVVAVPLTQLYNDSRKYGNVIASLPLQLSRFQMIQM